MKKRTFLGQDVSKEFSFLNQFDGVDGINLNDAFNRIESAAIRDDVGKIIVKVTKETITQIKNIRNKNKNEILELKDKFTDAMLMIEIICIKQDVLKKPILKENLEKEDNHGEKEDDESERDRLILDLLPYIKHKVFEDNIQRDTIESHGKMCRILLAVAEKKFGRLCKSNYGLILDYIKSFDIHCLANRYELRDLGGASVDITEDTSQYSTIYNAENRKYPYVVTNSTARFYSTYGVQYPTDNIYNAVIASQNGKFGKDYYSRQYKKDFEEVYSQIIKAYVWIVPLFDLFEAIANTIVTAMFPDKEKLLDGYLYFNGGMKENELNAFLSGILERDCNLTRQIKYDLSHNSNVKSALKYLKAQREKQRLCTNSDVDMMVYDDAQLSAMKQMHEERGRSYRFLHPFLYRREKKNLVRYSEFIHANDKQKYDVEAYNKEDVYKLGYEDSKNEVNRLCISLADDDKSFGLSLARTINSDSNNGGKKVKKVLQKSATEIKPFEKSLIK